MLETALFVLAGYLAGSMPFGYWLPRVLKGVDVRKTGSGNIGATNVWRAFGRWYGLPVVLLSADGHMEEKARALETHGAIRKPIDFAELLATIQRFTVPAPPPSS